MILIPSSLTQTTNFPDNDHFIVLMAPSPLCSMVSLPVLLPRPIEPSQLVAAAAAPPIVVEFVLTPTRPPVVRIRSPARPPDKNVLSLLYSGDSATACTGRPKLRKRTSLESTRDATHTLPSMEDVAIYIEFEGVEDSAGWLFGLGLPRRLEAPDDGLEWWSCAS